MSIAYYLITDILAFFLFAFLHSFLASFKVKKFLTQRIGNLMAFYRLAYNIFFLWFFFYLWDVLPKPDVELFELKFPWDLIILIPQILSLAGIIWALKYFSLVEFTGLSQIKRWKQGSFMSKSEDENAINGISKDAFDEKLTLKIEGPYKVVRHPLYLFTFIFLSLRPVMDLFYLVFLIFLIAYFYIGSFYEERKLVSVFGDLYRRYQETVPRLFPF
jgi:hypothetical protein